MRVSLTQLALLGAVCAELGGCGAQDGAALRARLNPASLCDSDATKAGLKTAIFGSGSDSGPGPEAQAIRRAAIVVSAPVLDEADRETGRVTCTAQLAVSFAPDARPIPVDLYSAGRMTYSIQVLADGTGVLYTVQGLTGEARLYLAGLVLLRSGALAYSAEEEVVAPEFEDEAEGAAPEVGAAGTERTPADAGSNAKIGQTEPADPPY